MRSLAVAALSIRHFRNLTSVDLELGPRLNVLSGANAQGKTNLLEVVYVLATSKSFRSTKMGDLVETGAETASVRGQISEGGSSREQSIGIQTGLRAARIDGKRPRTLAAYAVRTPTVVFHPGAVALSTGSGLERRKLLDRVSLYLGLESLGDAESYARAVRARQRVLEARGESARDLDGWEDLVVRHGAALSAARASAAARLIPAAGRAFSRIGTPGIDINLRYEPGAPEDPALFRVELTRRRSRDRARRSASLGPHRDDLLLALAGRPVRGIASQGQHRAVVLALQMAEIDVIASARGVHPVLLLDDVSSELDRARTAALFAALDERQGQVLLTTTRPELIATSGLRTYEDRRDFTVTSGRIAPGRECRDGT